MLLLRMTRKSINSRDLFVRGELNQLWKHYQKNEYSESDCPWILATLCFRGALDEAKLLVKGKARSSQDEFFLLIASVRKG